MTTPIRVPFSRVRAMIEAEEAYFRDLQSKDLINAGEAFVRLQHMMSTILKTTGWQYPDYEQAQAEYDYISTLFKQLNNPREPENDNKTSND